MLYDNTSFEDMVRSLRASTGRCSLLSIEKMVELQEGDDGRPKTNLYWFAIDPVIKEICKKDDFRYLQLFYSKPLKNFKI